MIVIADTSPINYLVLIDQIDILKQLYKRVLVPSAVLAELLHPLASKKVQDWAVSSPSWLEVLNPKTCTYFGQLDAGESAAIALAIEVHADLVLMDDLAGRQEATRIGLRVAGTLSVLGEADEAGLIVFDDAVAKLQKTSFRL